MTEAQEQEWLQRLFEFEYCEECGGDVEDHFVLCVLGNPFACCKREEAT
jgi:hypothetical protein